MRFLSVVTELIVFTAVQDTCCMHAWAHSFQRPRFCLHPSSLKYNFHNGASSQAMLMFVIGVSRFPTWFNFIPFIAMLQTPPANTMTHATTKALSPSLPVSLHTPLHLYSLSLLILRSTATPPPQRNSLNYLCNHACTMQKALKHLLCSKWT